jgi:DNA polymerase I-like protein with 3'-5' exonuclease and polymerase domains
VAAATEITRRVMEGVSQLRVPLRVDVATGSTLADVKG